MGGDDFVNVRLSKFGEEIAQGAPIRVHEGNRPEFVFSPGQAQRVTKAFDWERVLKQQTIGGRAMFEIVVEEEQIHHGDTETRRTAEGQTQPGSASTPPREARVGDPGTVPHKSRNGLPKG